MTAPGGKWRLVGIYPRSARSAPVARPLPPLQLQAWARPAPSIHSCASNRALKSGLPERYCFRSAWIKRPF